MSHDAPDKSSPAATVQSVGVVGAGVMGRSIALLNLQAGVDVVLTDSKPETLETAADWIESQRDASAAPGELRLTDDLHGLAAVDLVAEAVVENRSVKRRVFRKLGEQLPPETILASNTSSLLISELAAVANEPGRVCGIHFCHPVAERPLIEIIRSEQTTDDCIDRAAAYVSQLGKEWLIAQDVPGFAVNRLLFPYLDAAVDLVRAGVDWERIETCARSFGMPLGPLAQLDEIGIDVALRVAAAIHRGTVAVPPKSETLLALYQTGRLGRKTGAGFFRYAGDDPQPQVDPEAISLVAAPEIETRRCDDHELTRRLFAPMLNAAVELLQRGIVASEADVHRAYRDGLGLNPPGGDLFEWGRSVPN